jgi:hypothetical protein
VSSGLLRHTNVSEVLAASIIRVKMMEAASPSETSVNFYQTTWSNNTEDSHLHTCHHKNLKITLTLLFFFTDGIFLTTYIISYALMYNI